ncbi:ABC-type transport system involved in multi-copper enzyme maturation, permease component [Anaerobranca californiensis DSM 14826]|jgi:ABC-type transport system involved in multi-copper enzyme maturation permease subunit|uniref:ABC-type transport system involved in multi-copper enzyme maturation, permease component n=1 Tax=Anaerobranca californiensis DSM 14826 TaxID=1120989 RepID=A0A1M6REE8_9FIRM|nr:ABC transporter permease [Anaerobranca californiensis]SHK30829.1 ABC-type transport system involved in multi-copper enzyme maturation, permease component [Anaerobranca californiensis DSM 14826]
MGLLKFEFKKFLKEMKYLWLIFVVFLITTGIYSVYNYQIRFIQKIGYEELNLLEIKREWEYRQSELVKLQDQNLLTEDQEKQLYYIRDVGRYLYFISGHTQYGDWGKIIGYQKFFLDNLQLYSQYGGEFEPLEGIEREIAIAKNQWMLDHDLTFESEKLPISQHLFLKDLASFLLGKIGIVLILFFYGVSYMEEKERNTLKTLKTQPISNTKLIISKYLIYIVSTMIFILVVFSAGLLIPYLYNGKTLNFMYPQVLKGDETFAIITTSEYLIRHFIFFLCSASIAYGLTLLISKCSQRTLSLYILSGIVITIGYNLTFFIKHPINPFYYFRYSEILNAVPQKNDFLYLLFALIWTAFFLILAGNLPEQQINISFLDKVAKFIQQKLDVKKPFSKGEINLNRSNFFNLYNFEWRKIIREGQWKIILTAILIIVVSGHYFLTYLTEQRKEAYFHELNWRITSSEEREKEYNYEIQRLQRQIEDLIANSSPEKDPYYYNRIRSFEASIERIQGQIQREREMVQHVISALEGYERGDWDTFYQYQLLYIEENATNYNYFGKFNSLGNFTILSSIYEKNWLRDRNIRPVFSGEYVPNIHIPKTPRLTNLGWGGLTVTIEQFVAENTKMDNSGLFYLRIFYTHYLYLIPLLILLYFVGPGMAKERDKKNNFNLLVTQPIKEETLFISKFINSVVIILGTNLIVVILILVTGTFLNRFGDWQYPIIYYYPFRTVLSPGYQGFNFGQGMDFMTLGRYTINGTLLLSVMTVFFMGLANLISIFFKRTMSVFSTTTILAVVAFWLAEQKPLDRKFYSPITYFNIPKIINGEIGALLNEPKINLLTGIIVLIAFTMIFLIAGYLYIYIKNNRIGVSWSRLFRRSEKNDFGCQRY